MLKVFGTLASLAFAANAVKSSNWEKIYSQTNGNVLSPPLADNSTYGNTEQIHTTHVHLSLEVDFDQRSLSGVATHNMNVVANTNVVQFDVWDLTVSNVFNTTSNEAWSFSVEQPNPAIGSVLVVTLPRTVEVGESVDVSIEYSTSPTG